MTCTKTKLKILWLVKHPSTSSITMIWIRFEKAKKKGQLSQFLLRFLFVSDLLASYYNMPILKSFWPVWSAVCACHSTCIWHLLNFMILILFYGGVWMWVWMDRNRRVVIIYVLSIVTSNIVILTRVVLFTSYSYKHMLFINASGVSLASLCFVLLNCACGSFTYIYTCLWSVCGTYIFL